MVWPALLYLEVHIGIDTQSQIREKATFGTMHVVGTDIRIVKNKSMFMMVTVVVPIVYKNAH